MVLLSIPNSGLSAGRVRATPYHPSAHKRDTSAPTDATHLEPQVISRPAETAESKKLPLVAAHANILDGLVDDLGLAYTRAVRSDLSHVT